METKDLYIAPSDEIFNEIKTKAIQIWETSYNNTYGYVDEKVLQIKKITNFKDNATFIVAMFDSSNQNRLLIIVEGEAKTWLEDLLEYSRR